MRIYIVVTLIVLLVGGLAYQSLRVQTLQDELDQTTVRLETMKAGVSPEAPDAALAQEPASKEKVDKGGLESAEGVKPLKNEAEGGGDRQAMRAAAHALKAAFAKNADGASKKGERKMTIASSFEVNKAIKAANEAMAKGDSAGAIALMKAAVASHPGEAAAYRELARLYHLQGMIEEELGTCQSWMESMPNDAAPHAYLARLYDKLDQPEAAMNEIEAFRQSLDSNNPRGYAELADLYRRMGLPTEEGSALAQWTALSPDSPEARLAMAQYYQRSGDLQMSLSEYQTLVAMSPGDTAAHSRLASLYNQLGRHEEAQSQFMTALSLEPGNTNILRQMARSYETQGNPAAAIATYQQIIAMQPGGDAARTAERAIIRLQRPKPQRKPGKAA